MRELRQVRFVFAEEVRTGAVRMQDMVLPDNHFHLEYRYPCRVAYHPWNVRSILLRSASISALPHLLSRKPGCDRRTPCALPCHLRLMHRTTGGPRSSQESPTRVEGKGTRKGRGRRGRRGGEREAARDNCSCRKRQLSLMAGRSVS